MNKLLSAIVDDDARAVKKLLEADAGLASGVIREEKLYQAGIFHWIYVGDTALHLAAAGYRVQIVRRLIAAGADPNAAKNRRRSTPLHYAADGFITGPAWDEKHQVGTIRLLLDEGADIHWQDANGATPLHRAVRTRCAAAVKFLLRAGSDPTIENKSGSTPFHLAMQNTGRGGSGAAEAISAQREIIQAFLDLGVSPKLKNGQGKSVEIAPKARGFESCSLDLPRPTTVQRRRSPWLADSTTTMLPTRRVVRAAVVSALPSALVAG